LQPTKNRKLEVDGFAVVDLPGGINGGAWKPAKGLDERGFYVCGAQIRYLGDQGIRNDKAATGLRVLYCHYENWNIQVPANTEDDWFTIEEGGSGSWRPQVKCPTNYYVDGAEIQAEPNGVRDQTGVNGLRIRCRLRGFPATIWLLVYEGTWGAWRGECPGELCPLAYTSDQPRFVRKFQPKYGSDVGLADLRMIVEYPHSGVSREEINSSWRSIQSSPALNLISVRAYVEISGSKETTEAQQTALRNRISLGFRYAGVGVNIAVENPSSSFIVTTISSTITSGTEITSELSCPDGATSPSGQWFMWYVSISCLFKVYW